MEKGFADRLHNITRMQETVSAEKKLLIATFTATYEVVWKGQYHDVKYGIRFGWFETRAEAVVKGVCNPVPVDTTTLLWDDIQDIIQTFK